MSFIGFIGFIVAVSLVLAVGIWIVRATSPGAQLKHRKAMPRASRIGEDTAFFDAALLRWSVANRSCVPPPIRPQFQHHAVIPTENRRNRVSDGILRIRQDGPLDL